LRSNPTVVLVVDAKKNWPGKIHPIPFLPQKRMLKNLLFLLGTVRSMIGSVMEIFDGQKRRTEEEKRKVLVNSLAQVKCTFC